MCGQLVFLRSADASDASRRRRKIRNPFFFPYLWPDVIRACGEDGEGGGGRGGGGGETFTHFSNGGQKKEKKIEKEERNRLSLRNRKRRIYQIFIDWIGLTAFWKKSCELSNLIVSMRSPQTQTNKHENGLREKKCFSSTKFRHFFAASLFADPSCNQDLFQRVVKLLLFIFES